jgi:hypothetical protein
MKKELECEVNVLMLEEELDQECFDAERRSVRAVASMLNLG